MTGYVTINESGGGKTDMDRYTKEQLLGYVILAAKALNYTKEQISGNISY